MSEPAAHVMYRYQVLHIAYTNRYQYTTHAVSAHVVERAAGMHSNTFAMVDWLS